ncbi:MAG TPA: hypothetical protein VJ549_00560 [Geothrix sp.]|nr:hypothetical protein [Geothrix sp.]HJV47739.1 hypothetical protein [Geothrix sp.]
MTLRTGLLAILLAALGGFVGGRWSIPRGEPITIPVGPTRPLPARDISPKGEVRTVVVTRVIPGPPAAPPAPVPAELGQQLQTTDTPLPLLPQGAVLHDAIFGKVDDGRLVLRNVQWLDGPAGRMSLPEVTTTAAPVTLSLPAPPAPPRWAVVPLLGRQDGRLVYGAMGQAWWGPWGASVGRVGTVDIVGVGVRW